MPAQPVLELVASYPKRSRECGSLESTCCQVASYRSRPAVLYARTRMLTPRTYTKTGSNPPDVTVPKVFWSSAVVPRSSHRLYGANSASLRP